MDQVRAVSLFLSAAELGSFNRAAIREGLTPQAVSKSIGQLEDHLGVRLFHRSTRKLNLSEEGHWLLERVRPNLNGLLGALSDVRRQAKGGTGKVRIAAAGAVARNVVIPLLGEFLDRHPGVAVELVVDDLITDTVAQRIDVGFRAGSEPSTQVVSRRLFSFQHVICASPAYLRQHGRPRVWIDLAQHRCTGFRQPISGLELAWELNVGGQTTAKAHIDAMLIANETETELVAVLAGLGIGQLDTINAATHIRTGRLVPVLTEHVVENAAVYLYYPRRDGIPARVRLFIDFAVHALAGSNRYRMTAAELAEITD